MHTQFLFAGHHALHDACHGRLAPFAHLNTHFGFDTCCARLSSSSSDSDEVTSVSTKANKRTERSGKGLQQAYRDKGRILIILAVGVGVDIDILRPHQELLIQGSILGVEPLLLKIPVLLCIMILQRRPILSAYPDIRIVAHDTHPKQTA